MNYFKRNMQIQYLKLIYFSNNGTNFNKNKYNLITHYNKKIDKF